MVERQSSGKFSKQFSSRGSSSPASEFDEDKLHLEGKYLENGLEIRPPSGTYHQQPGSHLSIDTRLSELSLGTVDDYNEVRNGSFHESRSVSASSNNKHRVQVNKPNCYITSPFKQGYQVPRKGAPSKVVDPSYELKNVTKESIARVRQQFRKPKPPSQPSHYAQRLRKARLKTTGRPFSGSGPSIQQCKGIQSGVRVIHSSGQPGLYSNEVYSRMGSPSLRPGSPTELLRPESSLHCPSRASSKIDSNEDSMSEDSFEADGAFDSWINAYSKFERKDSSSRGADYDKEYVRDQDPISPTCRMNISNELCGHVRKIKLEIPQNDVVSDAGVLPTEGERFPKGNTGLISNEELNKQNQKELSDLNANKDDYRKHRTQNYDGCKPFTDDGDADHDDDDDGDDNQRKPQTLLSSCHSNRLGDGGQNLTSGLNRTIQGTKEDENKTSENRSTNCANAESCSSIENGTQCSGSIESVVPMRTENRMGSEVIIESSAGGSSPIMTVHVTKRDTTETADGSKESVRNSPSHNESTNVNLRCHNDDADDEIHGLVDDDDDNDDLDTDRIPSAQIWKNLDQLNLSMNAHLNRFESKNHLDFPLKARKVQSAGAQRKPLKMDTSDQYSNSHKTKQRSRASSAKRKNKNESKTMINKTELLRKYLSEENRRFSADLRSKLPGYFMDQFDIIQQGKLGNTSLESDDVQKILEKAIVKFEEEKTESNCNTEENMKSEWNGKENDRDSMLWECKDFQANQIVESYSDPTSFGVFFTMDSTSTEMESMSEGTEETTGDHSESREFSDDTGFETMPGSAGVRDKQSSYDAFSDDEKSPFKVPDYKQEKTSFYMQETLEVIAKAKHLTDPSSSIKNHLPAPYEPLKFYINAKPPAGYLFYFAYGVDMNIKRMSIYLRREHKRRWGVLFGFRLCFNKKGSSSDAGGFANVEFSPGSSVEGCVYTLTDAELSMLDNCMGCPKHYTRAVLPVWMCNSYQPSLHGVAQYCVPTVLYIAEQQWIQPDAGDTLDNSYSVSQCLKAADILTPSYVEYLNHLKTSGN